MIWFLTITGAVIIVIVMTYRFRKHAQWFANQSPCGEWECVGPDVRIYMDLRAPNDEARSGTFVRVTEDKSGTTNETGSWALKSKELRLMIFAFDGPGNKDLGSVEVFNLRYNGPTEISLDSEQGTKVFQRTTGFES